MMGQTGFRRTAIRLGLIQRSSIPEILGLEERSTNLDATVFRNRLKQGVQKRPAAIVHMARLIAEMVRIIPLAPRSHDTGLEDKDHIRIGLPVGFVLCQMLLHDLQRSVFGGLALARFVCAFRIGETDNRFHA